MDSSARLHLTQKGVDELQHRVYKLNLKKRSVLILLDTPHTVEQVLHKSVFPPSEISKDIQLLIQDGFIQFEGQGDPPAQKPSASAPQAPKSFYLDDEIILSEAKFLLADYCVDYFGSQSKLFAEEIRACYEIQGIRLCLNKIVALTGKYCPDKMPLLLGLIAEINETA